MPASTEEVRNGVGSMTIPPNPLSITAAATLLEIPYHRLLSWIKTNRYELGKHCVKVKGGGWLVDGDAINRLKEQLKKADT